MISDKQVKEFVKYRLLNEGEDIRYYFEDNLKDADFNYKDTDKEFIEYVKDNYENELNEYLKRKEDLIKK